MPFKESWKRKAYFNMYRRERCEQLRRELIKDMGGKCARCGSVDRLEFDHVGGWRDYNLENINSYTRILKYWREWKAYKEGKGPEVRILCKVCNLTEQTERHSAENYVPF